MTDMHHVPGRLRVRIRSVRRDPALAQSIEQRFRSVKGVRSIETSAVTGSVVIHYDPVELAPAAVVAELHKFGFREPVRRLESVIAHIARHTASLARLVAQVLVAFLIEKAIEHVIPALLVAIL